MWPSFLLTVLAHLLVTFFGALWFRVADPVEVGRAGYWVLLICAVELIMAIGVLVILARLDRWHSPFVGIAVGSVLFAGMALMVMMEFGSLPGIFAGLFLAKVIILPYR